MASLACRSGGGDAREPRAEPWWVDRGAGAFAQQRLWQRRGVHVPRGSPCARVAGARGGGTLVTVYGAGFIGTTATSCRFGEVAVPARLARRGTSPLRWWATVEVSTNGQDYSAGVHFEYQHSRAVGPLRAARSCDGERLLGSRGSARVRVVPFQQHVCGSGVAQCDGAAPHRAAACCGRDERRGDPE